MQQAIDDETPAWPEAAAGGSDTDVVSVSSIIIPTPRMPQQIEAKPERRSDSAASVPTMDARDNSCYIPSGTSESGTIDSSSGTSESESTQHDTLGLHVDERPNLGGVFSDETIGGVSTITSPQHYIPAPQICVPKEMNVPMARIQEFGTPRANLQAGLDSLEAGRLDLAAEHLALGREQVGPSGWEDDKHLTLKLCNEGADLAYMTGDTKTMNDLIDKVLIRRDLTAAERFRMTEVKLLADRTEDNFREQLTLGLDFLKELDLATLKNKPRPIISIIAGYTKTNRALGNRTAEELASLPPLTDERFGMGLRIAELIVDACYQAQPTLFPLLVFWMVREMLKHGITRSSIDAFSGYGIILCGVFRKPQRGREMAMASELLLKKYPEKKSRVTFAIQGYMYHWTVSLRDTLEPLEEGHRHGTECGDIDSAGLCLSVYLDHTFYSGCKLEGDSVKELIARHIGFQDTDANTTVDHRDHTSDLYLQVFLLALKKLRGVVLEENEKDFEDLLEIASETGNQTLHGYLNTIMLDLKVFFGEWKEAADILHAAGDVRDEILGSFGEVRFTI